MVFVERHRLAIACITRLYLMWFIWTFTHTRTRNQCVLGVLKCKTKAKILLLHSWIFVRFNGSECFIYLHPSKLIGMIVMCLCFVHWFIYKWMMCLCARVSIEHNKPTDWLTVSVYIFNFCVSPFRLVCSVFFFLLSIRLNLSRK